MPRDRRLWKEVRRMDNSLILKETLTCQGSLLKIMVILFSEEEQKKKKRRKQQNK